MKTPKRIYPLVYHPDATVFIFRLCYAFQVSPAALLMQAMWRERQKRAKSDEQNEAGGSGANWPAAVAFVFMLARILAFFRR